MTSLCSPFFISYLDLLFFPFAEVVSSSVFDDEAVKDIASVVIYEIE